MNFRFSHIAVLLLIFFSACKKNKKDTTPPTVSIQSPASGSNFHMFDTIPVTVHVSDETHLTAVTVTLVDANNSVLQYTYNVPIQNNDFTFTAHYVLTNYHLESGLYNISVTAYDGTNNAQHQQQIFITESPTLRTGFFIVGATQPKTVTRYDNSFAQQATISLTTGFNGMVFAPYYQLLFVNGNINQQFLAYDAVYGTGSWTLPYTGTGLPTFECVATDGQKPFIGYYAGNVKAETYAGFPSTNYSFGSNTFYPYSYVVTTKYGIGLYHDKTGGTDKLASFVRTTGTSLNNVFMPVTVIGVFEHTQDELYVLGNNSLGQAVFYLYDASMNGLQGPFNLPPGKLLSAALADSDHLLLAMNTNMIYCYQYSNSNYTILANITAQKLFYSPKMRELDAAASNTVYSYSLSTNYTLTQTGSQTLPDSVIGFEVITNK